MDGRNWRTQSKAFRKRMRTNNKLDLHDPRSRNCLLNKVNLFYLFIYLFIYLLIYLFIYLFISSLLMPKFNWITAGWS